MTNEQIGLRLTGVLVAAMLVSCGGESVAPPVATTLAATSSTSIQAVAGSAVSDLPAVIVKDQSGNAMPNVPVTFAMTAGGGTISGASAMTGTTGTAVLGGWTLGTSAGSNTVTATSGSLPAVIFVATGIAGPATSMTKSAGDNQTGTVGAAVATAPSVTLRDVNSNLVSGATVTFTASSGGGSATGGSATTNSSGVASVGAWTLGTAVGTNTLTATAGSIAAVTFTATANPGAAAALSKTTGDNQTATVNSTVAVAPTVKVADAFGNAIANATVTFAVASGGGIVTGASQTTNSAGLASAGSWKLGSSTGTNTLTASSGSLAAVTFSATATAPVAASVTKTAGDGQSTLAGDPVSILPSVTVRDNGGNLLAGVTVTFAPGTNGGTVTGGTQTTNASGVATVGKWRVGSPGTSQLNATVSGVAPAAFTATAQDPCAFGYTLTVGTPATWDLQTLDCRFSTNQYYDNWVLTALPAGAYNLRMTSTQVDSWIRILSNTAPFAYLAFNNDSASGNKAAFLKTILPAGNYAVQATTSLANELGDYTISASTTSEGVTNCARVFVIPGTTTSQTVQTTDCRDPHYTDVYYLDEFQIRLTAGQQITVNMNSTSVDAYLYIVDANTNVLAYNDDKDSTTLNSEIVYTAPSDGWYFIWASTEKVAETGAYTLTIR